VTRPSLIDLKLAYTRNENITRILRESAESAVNDQSAILIAYDFQAGSYVQALDDPTHRSLVEKYTDAISAILYSLRPRLILEPGVGEATTLREVHRRLADASALPALGFDLSWSRVHVGRRHFGCSPSDNNLFVGELESIALPDNAADVVYTSHAVEPNHGREAEILQELYRVTIRYLVLFEPSYEFGSPEARVWMEAHGYCRGLREVADRMGWSVVRHELLGVSSNPLNPTGVLVIEKRQGEGNPEVPGLVCPSCRGPLVAVESALFCAAEGLAYPILRGIPCLARHNAILASKLLD
jgi:ubiquinone/menaquinone biosynthesis C-methylase UbiE